MVWPLDTQKPARARGDLPTHDLKVDAVEDPLRLVRGMDAELEEPRRDELLLRRPNAAIEEERLSRVLRLGRFARGAKDARESREVLVVRDAPPKLLLVDLRGWTWFRRRRGERLRERRLRSVHDERSPRLLREVLRAGDILPRNHGELVTVAREVELHDRQAMRREGATTERDEVERLRLDVGVFIVEGEDIGSSELLLRHDTRESSLDLLCRILPVDARGELDVFVRERRDEGEPGIDRVVLRKAVLELLRVLLRVRVRIVDRETDAPFRLSVVGREERGEGEERSRAMPAALRHLRLRGAHGLPLSRRTIAPCYGENEHPSSSNAPLHLAIVIMVAPRECRYDGLLTRTARQ